MNNNEISAAATPREYGAEGGEGTPNSNSALAAHPPPRAHLSVYARRVIGPEERARRYDALHAGLKAGRTITDIAKRVGIPHEEFRRWMAREQAATERQARAARMVKRDCMRCRDPFESEGPHHRHCVKCRGWLNETADSPYAPDPGGTRGRQVPRAGKAR